jgi:aldose 1-epimerase
MATGRRSNPLSGRQYPIAAGPYAAMIAEVGAGLRSYTFNGVDVTCSYGEDELPPKCCGVTLAPWPNRIAAGRYVFDGVQQQLAITEPAAGNAIHGLGRWARWSRVRQTVESVTLRCDVVPQNGYPFQVRVEVTYSLHPEHGLIVTLGARNTGQARAPFGAGSHPYLSTHGRPLAETTVQLPARQVLVVDDAQIPVGTRSVAKTDHDLRRGKRLRDLRFDTGFGDLAVTGGRGQAEVRTKAGGARLWFDETFRYLQVFTREDLTPGQHGVAIEPMTCAPDAFNSGAGLIVLEPGGAWSGSWGITPV